MKTNVIMKSPDRELYGVVIRQDTKGEFLCLTDLQNAYAKVRFDKGWQDRRVETILSSKSMAERVFYIARKRGYIKNDKSISEFKNEVNKTSLVKVLKKYKMYKTMGVREERRVICDPYVWVMIALEMNPEIYADVIFWVTDKLIINRIEVGDRYNTLSRAVARFDDADYRSMAKALNWIVFNQHETNIRNRATQEQLRELEQLQSNLAFSIEAGFIKSFDELMSFMREIYAKKNNISIIKREG